MANLKILTISSIKGGVGKTVSSVNIAACMAVNNEELNVILIDLDPSGNSSMYLGYEPAEIDMGSKELFDSSTIFEECVNGTIIENLFVIPAEISMKNVQVMAALGELNYENPNLVLKNKIDDYRERMTRDTVIIIDTHPDFDLFTLNALMCSDRVICPVEHCNFSLHGFDLLINTANHIREKFNNKLRVLGLFKSNWDKANSVAVKKIEENMGMYYAHLFKSTIPSSIIVEESKLKNTPLILLNKNHNAAKGYMDLTNEILERWEMFIR